MKSVTWRSLEKKQQLIPPNVWTFNLKLYSNNESTVKKIFFSLANQLKCRESDSGERWLVWVQILGRILIQTVCTWWPGIRLKDQPLLSRTVFLTDWQFRLCTRTDTDPKCFYLKTWEWDATIQHLPPESLTSPLTTGAEDSETTYVSSVLNRKWKTTQDSGHVNESVLLVLGFSWISLDVFQPNLLSSQDLVQFREVGK